MALGLDGIAFRGEFCAVPADNLALPSRARLLAHAISKAERGARWERELLACSWRTNFTVTLIHT